MIIGTKSLLAIMLIAAVIGGCETLPEGSTPPNSYNFNIETGNKSETSAISLNSGANGKSISDAEGKSTVAFSNNTGQGGLAKATALERQFSGGSGEESITTITTRIEKQRTPTSVSAIAISGNIGPDKIQMFSDVRWQFQR